MQVQIKATLMSVPKKAKTSYPPLRLVSFTNKEGTYKLGVHCSSTNNVVDVCAVDDTIPGDMKSFLEAGQSAMEAANRLVAKYCILQKAELIANNKNLEVHLHKCNY